MERKKNYKYKRVYIDGVWDLFHYGHVNYIKKCKELSEHLIVGICSDEDCSTIKRKPIMTSYERMQVLKSCKYIDEIIENAPCFGISKDFINQNNIDIVMHGDDYSQESIEKYYSVPLQMGIFKTLSYTKTISTTNIINRLKDRILNKYINGHDNI